MRDLNQVTGTIVDCAYRIHTRLGPGLLESVYETVLAEMLRREGLIVQPQKWITFEFEGMVFKDAFRLDLLVEESVIVEIKSVEREAKVHAKQLHTYLRLTGCSLGLLINFGSAYLKDGIQRIANGPVPLLPEL
jgi:GxxExxY protein